MRRETHSIVREGVIAGFLGATAVAVWFFVVDLIAGHALVHTECSRRRIPERLRSVPGVAGGERHRLHDLPLRGIYTGGNHCRRAGACGRANRVGACGIDDPVRRHRARILRTRRAAARDCARRSRMVPDSRWQRRCGGRHGHLPVAIAFRNAVVVSCERSTEPASRVPPGPAVRG